MIKPVWAFKSVEQLALRELPEVESLLNSASILEKAGTDVKDIFISKQRSFSKGIIKRVIGLDIDDTMINSSPFHAIENRRDKLFAARSGMSDDFFLQARQDFKKRAGLCGDLAFTCESAATQMGRRFPYSDHECLTRMTVPFHKGIMMREKLIRPFPGVVETLSEVRNDPETLLVAVTECPDYLGAMRLHNTGILKYFDALIGIAPHIDDKVSKSFPLCTATSRRWIENIWRSMPEGCPSLTAGVLPRITKPNPTGLAYALDWAKVSRKASVIFADDKPHKGGLLIDQLKRMGKPNSYYVHARIGNSVANVSGGPRVDMEMTEFPQLLSFIRQLPKL